VSPGASTRRATGIGELDRVLGGGVVAGSAVLVAGDPGIGKSTLLLQAAGGLAEAGERVLYVSGEESPGQVRIRADRLGLSGGAAAERVLLLAETDLAAILERARAATPALLIVDSIQTVRRAEVSSSAGSVAQVRESAAALTSFAKATGIPVVLIGHVTKSGEIAGPRVLAHVVDAVISFEGDRYHACRVLRAVKNRFGTTDEIGLFEMRERGLAEVTSPSGLLLSAGGSGPGSSVVPAVEGTRVLLVEIQALCSKSPPDYPPRRRATGIDPGRLDMLLAVLAKKARLPFGGEDVFVNVVGGVKVLEPATDLAVALALASGLTGRALPADTVAFGEVGLKGEVRPAPRDRARLAEAKKLGFRRALVPPGTEAPEGLRTKEVGSLVAALAELRTPDSPDG
jgi:DNA repair protein RadA/Sms